MHPVVAEYTFEFVGFLWNQHPLVLANALGLSLLGFVIYLGVIWNQ